jgi:hypothetical protein
MLNTHLKSLQKYLKSIQADLHFQQFINILLKAMEFKLEDENLRLSYKKDSKKPNIQTIDILLMVVSIACHDPDEKSEV